MLHDEPTETYIAPSEPNTTVRVPAARTDLHDQPHRAFVEAALAEGLSVPQAALSDYPDLGSGVWRQPAPRLT